jgi:hypothetical protein
MHHIRAIHRWQDILARFLGYFAGVSQRFAKIARLSLASRAGSAVWRFGGVHFASRI